MAAPSLAGLVAFSHLQVSQIRGRQPYLIVRNILYVIRQFGYRKVRYRGIAKNGAQVFALLALANLYLARGRLVSA